MSLSYLRIFFFWGEYECLKCLIPMEETLLNAQCWHYAIECQSNVDVGV